MRLYLHRDTKLELDTQTDCLHPLETWEFMSRGETAWRPNSPLNPTWTLCPSSSSCNGGGVQSD